LEDHPMLTGTQVTPWSDTAPGSHRNVGLTSHEAWASRNIGIQQIFLGSQIDYIYI
jgi:hypothetical protein